MIGSILKFPYNKDLCRIVTKKCTFDWAAVKRSWAAHGPGILFYMICAVYLGQMSGPEPPTVVCGHLRRLERPSVSTRTSVSGKRVPSTESPEQNAN